MELPWQLHGFLSLLACVGWTGACLLVGLAVQRVCLGVKLVAFQGTAATLGNGLALGVGFVGAVWHLLALAGLMRLTTVVGVLTAAALLGTLISRSALSDLIAQGRLGVRQSLRVPRSWLPVIVLLAILVAYLGLATLSAPGTDAMAVYMAQAKLIAATGRLVPVRDYELFLHFGLTAELNFAALIILVGEIAAKMSVFFVALASAAVVWAISKRAGLGLLGCWAALVMLFTSTAFTLVLWDGKTDLYANLFGLATIYWAMRLCDGRELTPAMMVGVMAALAITNKPSLAVVLPPMIFILALWRFATGAKLKAVEVPSALLGSIIVMGLGAVFGAAPVVAKNWVLFNEPLAPFVYLNGSSGVAFDQAWYSPENTRWIVLTYPFALTLGKYPMQHGTLSALTLALWPLILLRSETSPRVTPALRNLTIAALVAVLAWIVARPSVLAPRYILPALLSFIPIVAFGMERLWGLCGWAKLRISALVLCAVVLIINIHGVGNVRGHLEYLLQGPTAYRIQFGEQQQWSMSLHPEREYFWQCTIDL